MTKQQSNTLDNPQRIRRFKIYHVSKGFTEIEVRWYYCNFCNYKTKNYEDVRSHVRDKHIKRLTWEWG